MKNQALFMIKVKIKMSSAATFVWHFRVKILNKTPITTILFLLRSVVCFH